jgi:hypothetical protein
MAVTFDASIEIAHGKIPEFDQPEPAWLVPCLVGPAVWVSAARCSPPVPGLERRSRLLSADLRFMKASLTVRGRASIGARAS